MADALQHAVEDWIAALYTACGAGSANAPKTETLDNTKHTAGCTTTALPGVAVAMVLLFLLKRTLCGESKLRKLYSGSEDAPELEEVATVDGGTARRLDDYALKKGRFVMGGHHAPAKAKPKGSSSSSSSSSSGKASRRSRDPELQPVCGWKH